MKFIEAKKRLKEMADGRYHSLGYELTEYHTSEQKAECTVYIDGYYHRRGPTWEVALVSMEQQVNGTEASPEEAPEEEAV